ncbi:MAG: DUF4390 domain-containing protein [Methylococcaceae bacterium]|nr:DUF4390 domain-containing protein [Methylococcaceae bacterium]
MAFIMLNCVRLAKLGLLIYLLLMPNWVSAEEYGVTIHHAGLVEINSGYQIETEIDYQLSPVAREALEKGVPLAWDIRFEIRRPGFLWTHQIYKQQLRQTLQYHALLKQYEVKTSDQLPEMFLTLSAALNFMSFPRHQAMIDPALIETHQRYLLAVRSRFNRELLPVPLRPFTYIHREWNLSSPWFIWPIQK